MLTKANWRAAKRKGDALASPLTLFSNSKLLDETLVLIFALFIDVIQQTSAASYESQQTATTRVILLVPS